MPVKDFSYANGNQMFTGSDSTVGSYYSIRNIDVGYYGSSSGNSWAPEIRIPLSTQKDTPIWQNGYSSGARFTKCGTVDIHATDANNNMTATTSCIKSTFSSTYSSIPSSCIYVFMEGFAIPGNAYYSGASITMGMGTPASVSYNQSTGVLTITRNPVNTHDCTIRFGVYVLGSY